MNLHLVNDEKFINESYKLFEKYYPGVNYFVVYDINHNKNLKHVIVSERILNIDLHSPSGFFALLSLVIRNKKKDNLNLFIHCLTPTKAVISIWFKKIFNARLYWIFYGIDLYKDLDKKNILNLSDEKEDSDDGYFNNKLREKFYKKIIRRLLGIDRLKIKDSFIENVDFFCFWNYYDYELLRRNYKTKAKFKYFRYFDVKINLNKNNIPKKRTDVIIVNHSASYSGNHLSILEKIKILDCNKELKKIYVPLSYGDDQIKEEVLKYGTQELSWCFKPLLNFMPKDKYFDLLDSIPTGIFGHKRQQAASNIFRLLASGTKVFLRKDNNLLKYLIDRGYVVFSFEDDLNTYMDLFEMNFNDRKKNKELVENELSFREINRTYTELLKS